MMSNENIHEQENPELHRLATQDELRVAMDAIKDVCDPLGNDFDRPIETVTADPKLSGASEHGRADDTPLVRRYEHVYINYQGQIGTKEEESSVTFVFDGALDGSGGKMIEISEAGDGTVNGTVSHDDALDFAGLEGHTVSPPEAFGLLNGVAELDYDMPTDPLAPISMHDLHDIMYALEASVPGEAPGSRVAE